MSYEGEVRLADATTRVRVEGVSVNTLMSFGWAFYACFRQGLGLEPELVRQIIKRALEGRQ